MDNSEPVSRRGVKIVEDLREAEVGDEVIAATVCVALNKSFEQQRE